jgi:undecaprenyl-diphosphatase
LLAPPVLAVLLYRGLRRESASVAVCLGGAAFLNWALKHFFVRARPDLFRVISETGYSFPSGHAMVSLCFYGMLAYVLGRRLAKRWQRLTLYALTGCLVMIIGFSRIYLGVHYPSDVAAGYIAGGTWLAFCVSLLWWWELKK